MKLVAILHCARCGSSAVDLVCWNTDGSASLGCCSCGQGSRLDGFSVGRLEISEEMAAEARADVALVRLGGDR
jgi:hypothetical protein